MLQPHEPHGPSGVRRRDSLWNGPRAPDYREEMAHETPLGASSRGLHNEPMRAPYPPSYESVNFP